MSKLVALVTGSCTGIGCGIVEELLRRGVDTVYMTGHIEQQGTEAIKTLKDKGVNPEFHILDVTDENSVKTCAEFIKNKHGGLNILVNNAGVITSDWEKTTYEDAVRVIGVNYKGILNVEKYFFPILKENARVVNIGSDHGHISNLKNSYWIEKLISKDLTLKDVDEFVEWYLESVKTGTWKAEDFMQTAMLSYKVSKIAVCALSRVQQKVVGKNISVNAIHPGYVKTGFTNWTGYMTPEEASKAPVYLALDVDQSVKGRYFWFDKTEKVWDDVTLQLFMNYNKIKHLLNK